MPSQHGARRGAGPRRPGRNHNARPPRPWAWPMDAQPAPAFPSPAAAGGGAPAGAQGAAPPGRSTNTVLGCPPRTDAGVPRQPRSGTGPTCVAPGNGLSPPGPPYLVMAPSEVRGGDAGQSNRDECGCARGDLVPSPWSPRSEKKLDRSPSPRGSDHSLSRAGARGAAWSCLAPAPTTSPERRPPRLPRDGKERREVVPLAKRLHR